METFRVNNSHPPETIQHILALAVTKTYGEIARECGLTRNAVAGIIHRSKGGGRGRGQKYRSADIAELTEQRERRLLAAREHQAEVSLRLKKERDARASANRVALRARAAEARSDLRTIRRQRISLEERSMLRKEANSIGSRNVTFMELTPRDCRWPTSQDRPFLFCALPADIGQSYCSCHAAVAYQGVGR